MITAIESIGMQLKDTSGIVVTYTTRELLAQVSLAGGRRQAVKLASVAVSDGPDSLHLLRFQSRACVARGPRTIQSALKWNAGCHCYGLALDGSTDPPVIDLLFHSILDPHDITGIASTIYQIASAADNLEQRASSDDVF